MSNINIEKEYDEPTSWLNFCIKQMLKNIYTCLPANIKTYDASTKRAVVEISLNLVTTNDEELPYPAIAEVPVIFPASSQYIIQFPLVEGDNVLVLFSQRGLSQFKETYTQSKPDDSGFFSLKDAVAIPGFGSLSNTPAQSDALTVQTVDGSTFMALKPGQITLTATKVVINGDLTINGLTQANDDITVTGLATSDDMTANNGMITQTLSIDGASLPPNHRHGGVQSGGSNTGTPVA